MTRCILKYFLCLVWIFVIVACGQKDSSTKSEEESQEAEKKAAEAIEKAQKAREEARINGFKRVRGKSQKSKTRSC